MGSLNLQMEYKGVASGRIKPRCYGGDKKMGLGSQMLSYARNRCFWAVDWAGGYYQEGL